MSEEKKDRAKSLITTLLSVIVSIIAIAIGWLFNINTALSNRVDSADSALASQTAVLSNKVDSTISTYTQIQTQLSQIQTDLGWLKKNSGFKY